MELHRLRLRNFRQHADTVLDLGPGLTGIVGPNGAGKSTLLEAIAWAVYGTPAARGTRETIRRRGAPPRSRVEVELEFSLGAHRYRVLRGLADASLFQDGGESPIATSVGGVSDRLARLLGMSREEFFSTYFTGQKELAILASMGAVDRARFLSRVLGFERLRTAQERLREARSVLRARLSGLEEGVPDPTELDRESAEATARVSEAERALAKARHDRELADTVLAAIRPRQEAMQQLQERVRSVQSDLRMADKETAEARLAMERLDHDLAEAIGARSRLDDLVPRLAALPALRLERDQLEEASRRAARHREAAGQIVEIERELAALDARLAGLATAEAAQAARGELAASRQALDAQTRAADELRTAWVRDTQDATTRRQQLLAQYTELERQRERLVSLGPEGACPTCSRVLGTEYGAVLAVLERQVAEIKANGTYFRQRLEQLSGEPADLVQAEARRVQLEEEVGRRTASAAALDTQVAERAALVARRAELARRAAALRMPVNAEAPSYDEARHAVVRDQIAELEPVAAEAARQAALAERAERLGAEMAVAEQRLSRAEAAGTQLRGELEGLGWTEEAQGEVAGQFAAATRGVTDASLVLARAESELAAARERLDTVGRRREDRDRRVAAIAGARLAVHFNQELDAAFSELRDDLNAQLRPDLAEVASGFLRDLTAGRYTDLDLDDQYLPMILDEGEPQPVLSGGEEDVVNLALRLAISQMIADRAGQPLSLLVLDEIFGSLDEERRAAVVELLRQLADRFPQVILITHIEAVREGFDRVVRVTYDAERATAVVAEERLPGASDVAA